VASGRLYAAERQKIREKSGEIFAHRVTFSHARQRRNAETSILDWTVFFLDEFGAEFVRSL
jgi:hypothetical protein